MSRNLMMFGGVALLFVATGVFQSWNLSLQILIIGVLSSIMALGVNMQWGYAGLFSTGIMGSVALGGLAVVLVGTDPASEVYVRSKGRMARKLGMESFEHVLPEEH